MQTQPQILTGWRSLAALLVLAALLAGPVTIVATTANPPPPAAGLAAAYAQLQGAGAPIANSVPPDAGDVGAFAFGYVEFDWDPKAPGGVPGFDSWPPASPRR